MAYEKQTWVTGEVITEEKLNHIEDGIEEAAQSGGALIVNAVVQGDNDVLDKNFAEIYEALHNGTPVYIKNISEVGGPSEDYACVSELASVIAAHKYDNYYRVYAVTYFEGLVTGEYYLSSPAVYSFGSSSLSGTLTKLGIVTPSSVTYIS